MVVRVPGCSGPSTFSRPWSARRCMASASLYLPCCSRTEPSWLTLDKSTRMLRAKDANTS
ncbi:hypothetical protein BDV12DRAFT_59523 [Aspergillus spectabilis]